MSEHLSQIKSMQNILSDALEPIKNMKIISDDFIGSLRFTDKVAKDIKDSRKQMFSMKLRLDKLDFSFPKIEFSRLYDQVAKSDYYSSELEGIAGEIKPSDELFPKDSEKEHEEFQELIKKGVMEAKEAKSEKEFVERTLPMLAHTTTIIAKLPEAIESITNFFKFIIALIFSNDN